MLCTQTPGGVHEDDYVQMLLERGVAGIIFVSGLHADTTDRPRPLPARCATAGLPIVLVNGYIDGRRRAVHLATTTSRRWSSRSSHLVQLGHTEIGLAVGPERFVPVIRKIAGFRHAMRALLGRDDVERPHRALAVHRRGRRGGGRRG